MIEQTLFKEKEVSNLTELIYGEDEPTQSFGYTNLEIRETPGTGEQAHTSANSYDIDSFKFEVNPIKLERYKDPLMKKLVKKKFVTGISKDKVLQNIMNMSDSDDEGRDKDGNTIDKAQKEQMRKMEDNSRKGTKLEKKRKRMENKGHKVETDSDENSEDIDDESGEDEVTGVKKKAEKKKE